MPEPPTKPSSSGGGTRAQRAADLKSAMESQAKEAGDAATGGPDLRPVKARETLEEIAAEYDMSPEEIWEHPNNEELVKRREDPAELEEGDALYIPGQTRPKLEPVGQGDYVVQDGDSMGSIAKDSGHFWENIWNDPANAELKTAREDPNVLFPGDRVTIPDIRPKQESGETEARHRFVRKGEPASLNVQVCVDDEPVANQPYVLVIDQDEANAFRGTTDADGNVAIPIPGNAREGVLRVGPEDDALEYELQLGHMNPEDDLTGVQRRLGNLGFDAPDNAELDFETREALRRFQREAELPVTGEMDETTNKKLRDGHGS